MIQFSYRRATTVDDAFRTQGQFLAGGTSLIDLMRLDVENPTSLIDVGRLPFDKIEKTSTGLRIGASVKNSAVAWNETVKKEYPVLAEAISLGASTQLRNKASTAGNLLQRTRCVYFRDPTKKCNKREPGSGCDAIGGFNRNLAILGTSKHCIATNPSDQNVALMALEAKIHVLAGRTEREIPISEFYLLPRETPETETVLKHGELITHVSFDQLPRGAKSTYLKLRDRQSYEFALASAAVIVAFDGDRVSHVRIAMGGVGTIPWRMPEAEKILTGQKPSMALFAKAAEAALKDAQPQSQNGFKIELAKRCLTAALKHVTNLKEA